MTSFAVLCVCAVSLAGALPVARGGAETAGPELRKEIRIPANIGFSTDISPDAQAATLIFDNLYVEVPPARAAAAGPLGQTAIQTKAVTVEVPYSSDQKSVAMVLDLRGYLSAAAGSSVRLVVCAGETTRVVKLPAAGSKRVELKGTSKQDVAAEHEGVKFGDYAGRVEFTVRPRAARPVCQVTLFLVAEHDADADGAGTALLAVDSLDLSFAKPSKGTNLR